MSESLPPILRLSARFRAELLRREGEAARRLVNAYKPIHDRLLDSIGDLQAQIVQMNNPTPDQIRRLERYHRLLAQVEDEWRRYIQYVSTDIQGRMQVEIARGLGDTRALVRSTLPPEARYSRVMSAAWANLDTDAVSTALGFFEDGSPLSRRLDELAPNLSGSFDRLLVQSIGMGYNPNKLGRILNKSTGMALESALKYARTAQLNAYRESNRAAYSANSRLVGGWVWCAQLGDPRTCLSCIALHGSVHPIDEPMQDHWNGRCRPLPAVDWAALGINMPALDLGPTGEQWFDSLSASEQQKLLGGRYDGWRSGQYSFSALSQTVDDPVWGSMHVEASMSSLLQTSPQLR